MNAWLSSFSSVELLKFWFLACPQRFNFYLYAENLNFHGWHPEEESIFTHMLTMQFLLACRRLKNRVVQILIIFCLSVHNNQLSQMATYDWIDYWIIQHSKLHEQKKWSFESSTIQVFLWTLYPRWAGAATLVCASRVWLMVMDLNLYHSKCFHKCNLSLQNHLIQSFGKHLIFAFLL